MLAKNKNDVEKPFYVRPEQGKNSYCKQDCVLRRVYKSIVGCRPQQPQVPRSDGHPSQSRT